MIPSPFHSSRGGKTVRLLVIHTSEGARTVEALGAWFQRPATKASSHAGVDDWRIETYVPYDQAAWTTRSANSISDNLEVCGWAKWTRAEWLTHDRMLDLTAQWIKERCAARNIPLRKLTAEEVKAGYSGVIGHVDWTRGMNDGTHTDPGPNFPWDVVLTRAGATPDPGAPSGTYCRMRDRGERVMKLQQFMTSMFHSYNMYRPTGFYGLATRDGVAEFQKRTDITGSDADGTIVGPRTLAKLAEFGFTP